MAKCSKINIPDNSICIGDLKHRIEIQARAIQPPPLQDPNYDISFTTVVTVMAAIVTFPKVAQFDESNVEQTASHDFYIRFIPGTTFTSENWILLDGVRYNILLVENLHQDDRFLRLRATLRGSETKRVNFR